MNRLADLCRLYALLDVQAERVGGRRAAGEILTSSLPNRGVYFFFEPGEIRKESGDGARVVRVGTHALGAGSMSTLKQRLRQHVGGRAGGGNHRGSIFRLLVGQALLAKEDNRGCTSWGIKGEAKKAALALGIAQENIKAAEAPVEQRVSAHIAAMSVVVIPVADEPGPQSMRGWVERNAIALLSNFNRHPLDPPSSNWLGHSSNRPLVRSSGLWNQNHVEDTHAASLLDELEQLVSRSPSL